MASTVPSNIPIEKLVLGSFLQNEENYWSVAEIVTMDMFASEDHQKIFAVINALATDGRAIRVPVVAGRLGPLADGQDPDAYLSALLHMVTREDSIPLSDFVDELRSSAMRRRLISLADSIAKAAADPTLDPDAVIDRSSERLADISRAASIEHESTVAGTVRQIVDQASSSAQKGIALRPCLSGLEEMVGFFPPGNLVLWGGGPGSGKTAMAMQQMLYSSTLHPCSLFELEMDNRSLVARAIAGETQVPARDIMRGMSLDQMQRLIEAEKLFSNRKLRIVSPSRMTIQQIRSRAIAHKRKFGLDIMFADHIKLIERYSKGRMDPVERAYENARDLKSLAKDLDCVVVALCQFTKMARQKEQPEPEMEDFYGGSLEEHADIMLANFNRHDWLARNPPRSSQSKAYADWAMNKQHTENRIEVYKLKDRFGAPRDRRIFHWNGKLTLFSDQSTTQNDFDFESLPRPQGAAA